MKKIVGNPQRKNLELIKKINELKINNYYINHNSDFREKIIEEINSEDSVLDIGRAMREKFSSISSKTLDTLDINDFGEYPNIVFDLCDKLDESLKEKYNKIICIAILEHVYNPFDAVKNLKSMLKPDGIIYGYVPYLYFYHAPKDLKFQDYFRFSKDALAYLFKDFSDIEIFPVRGRISTPLNILFAGRWKKYIEKTGLNVLLDKLSTKEKNYTQCSGYNFIIKK